MTHPSRRGVQAARRLLASLAWFSLIFLPGSAGVAQDRRLVALDLPLYDPSSGRAQVPAYAAHKFEVRLTAEAARAVGRPRAASRTLGLASLDARLFRVSARAVEPEFPLVSRADDPARAELDRYFVVHLEPGTDLLAAMNLFLEDASVESVQPIGIYPVQLVPNDSLFSDQYGFSQPSGLDSKLPEAWDLVSGDTSVVIAILDTGLQWDHPDLGGPPPHLGGSVWTNWAEAGGLPGVDDDGNGFVDDLRGWDFVDGVTGRIGEDLLTPDNDPSDFVGHGTRVAGVVGAIVNNGSGVAGAGRGVKLMPVRVGWHDNVNPGGVVDMSFCASAFDYARAMGAEVINCSWSNGNLDGLGAAVTAAINAGATVVVAAGNFGTSSQALNYLSTRGDCIDVAGLDDTDLRPSFSSYGEWVDVAGAAVGIVSTTSLQRTPSYGTASGTSFSAPLVSGIVGLYQSWRLAQGMPLASPQEVLLRVRDTADPVDAVNPGYSGFLGGGRVNALRMLTDPPTSFVVSGTAPIYGAPAVANWAGAPVLLAAGGSSGLSAWDAATQLPLAGWPILPGVSLRTDVALADLDGDGIEDVLAGGTNGVAYAVRADGTALSGWPRTLSGAVSTGPAVGDVNGDGELDVVVGAAPPGDLYALDARGQTLPGWPVRLPTPLSRRPAVFDVDGDGAAEIAIGAADSSLCILRGDGTLYPGWPVKIGGFAVGSPSFGDLDMDGNLDLVVGATNGLVYALSRGGVSLAGWPASAASSVNSSPALADLDGDGRLEVLVAREGNGVAAWNDDGTTIPGWPVPTTSVIRADVIVAQADADVALEVLFGGNDGRFYVVNPNGTPVPGWPRRIHNGILRGSAAVELDGDGQLEVVIPGENGRLHVQDMGPGSYDADRLPWFTAGRAFTRHGATGLVGAPGPPPPPGGTRLTLAVRPNPSIGTGRIELRRGAGSSDHARFRLIDVTGRIWNAETLPFDDTGVAIWILDGHARSGASLPAGVYLVEAASGSETASGRWVYLR